MPAEHVGIVRENYLWEVLLRRSVSKDGIYVSSKGGECDRQLFKMCWRPIVVALSMVFEKATDLSVCGETVEGFRYRILRNRLIRILYISDVNQNICYNF